MKMLPSFTVAFVALTVLPTLVVSPVRAQRALPPEGHPGHKVIMVRDKDHLQKVTLTPGDMLEVHLPVNAGTGYAWQAGPNDGKLWRAVGNAHFQVLSHRPGGPVDQSFQFKAQAAGEGTLLLQLFGPVDRQNATRTVTIPVSIVAPSPAGFLKTLKLSDDSNGSKQALHVGDVLVLRLNANPSTGYTWNIVGALPAPFQQQGTPTFASSSPDAVGAGGVSEYRFKVLAPGTGRLRLEYRRSWEKDVPAARSWEIAYYIPENGK